jgi:rare lipoprotein A
MKKLKLGIVLSIAIAIGFGCSNSVRFTSDFLPKKKIVGESSVAVGTVFYGKASYYGKKFHGRLTSNGETFDMNKLTAAHRSLPFGTKLKVTNLKNSRSVVVRINDRGPFKATRIIDLSKGAATQLSMIGDGIADVKLEVIGKLSNELDETAKIIMETYMD